MRQQGDRRVQSLAVVLVIAVVFSYCCCSVEIWVNVLSHKAMAKHSRFSSLLQLALEIFFSPDQKLLGLLLNKPWDLRKLGDKVTSLFRLPCSAGW